MKVTRDTVKDREQIEELVRSEYPDTNRVVFSLAADCLYVVAVFRTWEDENRRYGKQFVIDAASLPVQMPKGEPSQKMVDDVKALAETKPAHVVGSTGTGMFSMSDGATVIAGNAEGAERKHREHRTDEQLGLGVGA